MLLHSSKSKTSWNMNCYQVNNINIYIYIYIYYYCGYINNKQKKVVCLPGPWGRSAISWRAWGRFCPWLRRLWRNGGPLQRWFEWHWGWRGQSFLWSWWGCPCTGWSAKTQQTNESSTSATDKLRCLDVIHAMLSSVMVALHPSSN